MVQIRRRLTLQNVQLGGDSAQHVPNSASQDEELGAYPLDSLLSSSRGIPARVPGVGVGNAQAAAASWSAYGVQRARHDR
jgi:hypothetical protein